MFAPEQRCPICGEWPAGRNKRGEHPWPWAYPVCPKCVEEYFCPELKRCSFCGKILAGNRKFCISCQQKNEPKHIDKGTVLGVYQGRWKEFIWKVKYGGEPYLLQKISAPLAKWALLSQLPPPDGVVGVPMHRERFFERGFNQADIIASLLHWELAIPILKGIERVLPTQSQVFLTRDERLINLSRAFKAAGSVWQNKTVWLVDDVVTTGATLEACARTLKEAGVKSVYTLCLAGGLEKSSCS